MDATSEQRARGKRPKVHMIVPARLQDQHGIANFTEKLAAQLRESCAMTLLVPEGSDPCSGEGVKTAFPFSLKRLRDVVKLVSWVKQTAPDWLVIQYDPGSFYWREINLWVPYTMWRIHRTSPLVNVMAMVHEGPHPPQTLKGYFRAAATNLSLWIIGRNAQVIAFSIDPWLKRYAHWFPNRKTLHLPVASNIERTPFERSEARRRLGIDNEAWVIGMFGRIVTSLEPELVREAILQTCIRAHEVGNQVTILYIGNFGEALRPMLPENQQSLQFISDGSADPVEVSRRFAAMDIFLAPYRDGVSTRRTSVMCALQHGIAVATTSGPNTDALLSEQDDSGMCLTPLNTPNVASAYAESVTSLLGDRERRRRLGHDSEMFYQSHLSWEAVKAKWLQVLRPGYSREE